MAKIKNFEKNYDLYDDWFIKNNLIYEDELKCVKELVGSEKNGLEIGIGTGKFALELGIKIGVEPSKEMRKIAQKKGLDVIDGVGEMLPFKDESFNFVFINTTICFFDNPIKALQEAYRVIKYGGFIVVGFIDKDSKLGQEYQVKKNKSKFYQEATFFSTAEVNLLLKKSYFVNCTHRYITNTEDSFVFIKCKKES